MLDEATLRRALNDAGLPDGSVRYDDVTDSTNATALAMAREGAPEWTLVAARHQTAGRGRLGRSWISEPGGALLFSLVLRPRLPPDLAPLLSLLAGVAMVDACGDCGISEVTCKWPNDLLLGGRKVGGILTEAELEGDEVRHVVVGVGLNVGKVPSRVDGAAALGGDVEAGSLLRPFLAEFASRYGTGPSRFADSVLRESRRVSATLGKRVRATTLGGRTVEGTAVDLDERGNLVVDTDTGPETIGFGEVQHLR
jgi:BirA family biotin operon repressor/biotin-[acetyl-CoA-carboxylase] ligase